MKLLKIDNNSGYYYNNQDEFATVDKITKDDILRLVNLTLGEEEVEFDEFSDENLKNQAHKIIYKSILEKLQDLKNRKDEFIDESERLHFSEYERYRDELSQQDDTPPDETGSVGDTPPDDDDIMQILDGTTKT